VIAQKNIYAVLHWPLQPQDSPLKDGLNTSPFVLLQGTWDGYQDIPVLWVIRETCSITYFTNFDPEDGDSTFFRNISNIIHF